ncbi:MAG TPA: cation-translocating P-type ATPase [Chloroflexota bacterium]
MTTAIGSRRMEREQAVEFPVVGMDCAECVSHVHHAISELPGVYSATVLLSAEKAIVRMDPSRVSMSAIREAVAKAGYAVPDEAPGSEPAPAMADFTRRVLTLFGIVCGVALFAAVIGERLGFFEAATERVPWPVWLLAILAGGYPVFRSVILATLRRQVISHHLMTLGVIAAAAVGQWPTAAVVVFFMRVGDYAERFTAERARRAVKDLTAMAPQKALVERDGAEALVPATEVRRGEVVIVRPGDRIPVDGEVVSGQATIDQAAITGESMPVEASEGSEVYAATVARLGSIRVRATGVGSDTTFGRVIRLVEEAESNRADVQRIADRFSAIYLPVVAGVAALTLAIRHDPLATAAVLVVACSCSFAMATPIAMLASIGAGAKRGLMIKGGKHLEVLARADVLLIDKTGTLTLGRPRLTDVVPLNGLARDELLGLAASAERFSEHPLAEAVRNGAREAGVALAPADDFRSVPGQGVTARVRGRSVSVGSRRLVGAADLASAAGLEADGKTVLFVAVDGTVEGVLAASDTLRAEVPAALKAVKELGIRRIELLTGDNERAAASLAAELGIDYRSSLLPEDKIRIVKDYQSRGHTVVMVGDGVNDAPALAQANVGIAMGAAGSGVALEAAHIGLMREDWALVPEVLRIARRTMRVVKMNIGFTALYNVAGLSLAALGILPPILAAAAQSLPDIGIMANSSRLLRQR